VTVAVCLVHFGNAMPAINHYTHKRFGKLYKITLVLKTPVVITIFILKFLADSMGGIDFIQVGIFI